MQAHVHFELDGKYRSSNQSNSVASLILKQRSTGKSPLMSLATSPAPASTRMEVSLCRSLLSPELCLYFDDYLDQLDHISHLDHRGQVQHSPAAGIGEVEPVIPFYQQPWKWEIESFSSS